MLRKSQNQTIFPIEILYLIFDHLLNTKDYKSMVAFSKVCQLFNDIKNTETFAVKISQNKKEFTAEQSNLRLFAYFAYTQFQSCVRAIYQCETNRLTDMLSDSVLNTVDRPNNYVSHASKRSLLHYAIDCYFYSHRNNKKAYREIISLLINKNANLSLTMQYNYCRSMSTDTKKHAKQCEFFQKILGIQIPQSESNLFPDRLQLDVTPLQYAQILGKEFKDNAVEKLISPESSKGIKCKIM